MNSMTTWFAAAALLVLAGAAGAAETVFAENGVAIRGADPVAYFAQGKATKGDTAFEHAWMGATWRFASAANRDAFRADPAKYAPQYGGWCAWAVSQNYTAPIDPEAWKIVGGRLFLNYSKSVQGRWALDESGNIAKGDRNWPGLKTKLEGGG